MSVKSNKAQEPKPTANWEERQKLASFHQALLNPVQQAAVALFVAASLTITLAIATTKLSGVTDGQDWYMILVGLAGWWLLIWMIVAHFRPIAARINAVYLDEHRHLFPGAQPYRLESFLLQRSRKGSGL